MAGNFPYPNGVSRKRLPFKKKMLAPLSGLVLGALVLAGCAGQTPRPPQSSSPGLVEATLQPTPFPSIPEVIVTRDNNMLPAGCSPREVAQLIMRFFDAFNNGDQEVLGSFFFKSGFEWYSVTEGNPKERGRHFVAYTPDDLLVYFVERHKQNERLRLLMVDVAGPSWHGGVDISYVLNREADDLWPGLGGPERIAEGKGAINCQDQQIFVWSMAMNMGNFAARLCPEPPTGSKSDTVVACARE